MKIGFLYFGRLDKEKGFDAILDVVEGYLKEQDSDGAKKKLPFKIFIFGKGEFEERLKKVLNACEDVHYFGFQPLDVIMKYLPNCHYMLMPSRFLETFGLTALNSLSRGIPVVGYKKGGLENFVFEELALGKSDLNLTQDLGVMIHKLCKEKHWITGPSLISEEESAKTRFYDKSLEIAQDFMVHSWAAKFIGLLEKDISKHPSEVKILMVSDFSTRLGGIETYVHDVAFNLRAIGYDVHIIGKNISGGTSGKMMRYFGVGFLAICNIFFAIRLLFKIRKFKPDLIWFNSTLRWIGWLGFLVSSFSDAKQRFMFHDFGYFHPFPSRVFDEKDIKTPLNLKNFLKMAKTKNILKMIAVSVKYFNVYLVKVFSKKYVDRFLVPSDYMKNIVHKSYKLEEKRIDILSHFIQE